MTIVAKIPLRADPEGRNPSAPPIEILVHHNQDMGIVWFEATDPAAEQPGLCEAGFDYYNGELRLMKWDAENYGGDMLVDGGELLWAPSPMLSGKEAKEFIADVLAYHPDQVDQDCQSCDLHMIGTPCEIEPCPRQEATDVQD